MEKVKEVKKKSLPQVSARLTNKQWNAFDIALTESLMSHVEFVRYAIMLACKEQGVEFPLDDMPRAGTYERNKVSE